MGPIFFMRNSADESVGSPEHDKLSCSRGSIIGILSADIVSVMLKG